MKFLKLLIIPLLFFACKSEECPIPVCSPPFLPDVTIIFDSQFSNDELSEIILTTRLEESGEILSVDTINNLTEKEFNIAIENGQFEFIGVVAIDFTLVEESTYFYELEIPNVNYFYTIDKLTAKNMYTDECSCPEYSLHTIEVNGVKSFLDSNTVILEK